MESVGNFALLSFLHFIPMGKSNQEQRFMLSWEALKLKSPGTVFCCLFVLLCGMTGRTMGDKINGISLTHPRW